MYYNFNHVSIPEVKQLYEHYLATLGDIESQVNSTIERQLEIALMFSDNGAWKVQHPLFIKGFKTPMPHYRKSPLLLVGLDIETNAQTGEPRLIGLSYPNGLYQAFEYPNLENFAAIIRARIDDEKTLITWGNLDIQCLIRLFAPTDKERVQLSRGISATITNNKMRSSAPISRELSGMTISIAHYIPGRALKIALTRRGRVDTAWIYNASQFWTSTIAQTAKGLNLGWEDFDRDTHLIDWKRFSTDAAYHSACIDSNKQDARIVRLLGENLQATFYSVFHVYPTLLVSTGSLVDSAVSKLLDNDTTDYQSNSFRWLTRNVWPDLTTEDITSFETILSDAYSAGLVDQYGIGYYKEAWTADISSAYPAIIRTLPDLRHISLHFGKGKLKVDIAQLESEGYSIESAFIRGILRIPKSLMYHPITVKTPARENIRPTGEFWAGYILEERQFCEDNDAEFDASSEEYVILAYKGIVPVAPVAVVSQQLGQLRDSIRAEMQDASGNEKIVKDSQQYIIKIIDNSLYGKTVQTVEEVEDIDGTPTVVGYIAGDRYNLIYGTLITARTRVALSRAMVAIKANGGTPIMAMTDSVYWYGTGNELPSIMIRVEKTAGFFEPTERVDDFYIVKTGQYEYRHDKEWTYKLRGLPVVRDLLKGDESFLRALVKAACVDLKGFDARDIKIPVSTRRLISIGKNDLDNLGKIEDGETLLKPFILSSKSAEGFIENWPRVLDDHQWLKTIEVGIDNPELQKPPLIFLSTIYREQNAKAAIKKTESYRAHQRRSYYASRVRKAQLVIQLAEERDKIPPDLWQRLSLDRIREYFNE